MAMNKLTTIFFYIMTIAFVHGQEQQDLSAVLNKIKAINEVQYEYVGFAATPSDNYKNYLDLKSRATSTQLVELTDDNNAAVACYAGWALIDNSNKDLPSIFIKFLNNDKNVSTFNGCIKSLDTLSSEFYHRYWNGVSEKSTDKTLFSLDSLILYKDNSNWLLITRALENRIYPTSFNQRIEYLAFTKTNKDAINYLKKLNDKAYEEPIKLATIKYFKETDFNKVGISVYLETLKELLNYNDEKLKPLITEKLKKDIFWRSSEKEFTKVLAKNGIQLTNIK